jgi:hypothetical protein
VPHVVHQIDRALLEHTGSDAFDDVVPAAVLQDDGVDALPVQQVAENPPGRSGADDPDLCADAFQLAPMTALTVVRSTIA